MKIGRSRTLRLDMSSRTIRTAVFAAIVGCASSIGASPVAAGVDFCVKINESCTGRAERSYDSCTASCPSGNTGCRNDCIESRRSLYDICLARLDECFDRN